MTAPHPIGGYFGLEVRQGNLPYPKAVAVNFGRAGLELIVRQRGYRKVWMPDYICPSVPEYLDRMGIPYGTYEIGTNLEPITLPRLKKCEALLYVNYFGVKDAYCRKLERTQNNLILDLTQAFYYVPRKADGFNSARKFFGVPDGGFVFGKGLTADDLPESHSYDKCEALLHRADGDIAGGHEARKRFGSLKLEEYSAKISQLSRILISGCNIEDARCRRVENFQFLAKSLRDSNLLSLSGKLAAVPLVYPYLTSDGEALKRYLISKQVFCATYWPGMSAIGEFGNNILKNLVCLPCDQRYGCSQMRRVLDLVREYEQYEIYLRPLRTEDAKVSWRWRNNPVVWANTGSRPTHLVTKEIESAWIRKAISDPSIKRFAICLQTDDRYIGNAYIGGFANSNAVEQIFIGEPQLWGRGIGTRARAQLYKIAAHEWGVRRIVTEIRLRNIASRRSVEKLGFKEFYRDSGWVKLSKDLKPSI